MSRQRQRRERKKERERETDWDTSGSSEARESVCVCRLGASDSIEREDGLGVETDCRQWLEMSRDRSREQEMGPEKWVHRSILFFSTFS